VDLDEYRRMHALEESHWWFRAKRRMVYALLEAWCAGGRVVDVGCGTGIVLQRLPAAYAGVGVDPSQEALALCRERGLAALARGSATALPLADASADAVLALDIIEHVEEDRLALSEVARVLRPGGVAVITVPAFPFLWSPHDVALHHKRRYTRRSLERRLAEAGLKVRVGGYGQASILPAAALLRLARRALRRWSGPEGGSDVREAPAWLNAVAYRLLAWEVPFVRRGRLPAGLSLVYVVSPRGCAPRRSPLRATAASGVSL
jgi:SAM-dependent methyltransferase